MVLHIAIDTEVVKLFASAFTRAIEYVRDKPVGIVARKVTSTFDVHLPDRRWKFFFGGKIFIHVEVPLVPRIKMSFVHFFAGAKNTAMDTRHCRYINPDGGIGLVFVD